ncbi:MAG: TonB-dependent receptor, partial [Desulfobacteraceae bacterium]|nr:TonB-dependent receptor [Desulfobacteraceae bacterium]
FGEHGTQNLILNHGGAKGKFNYWLTYSSRKSDGYELSDDFDPNNPVSGIGTKYNEDGGVRDLSYYDNQTLNTKIGYDFDNNSRVYLSFDYHDNERGVPTAYDRYWEFDHWKQWHLNLVGEHDITDNVTIKGRLYYVDHENGLTDVSWDANHTTDPKKRWFARSAYDDYSLGGDFQTYINMTENNLLKLGVTYKKDVHTQQDYYDALSRPVWQFGESVGYQPRETYKAVTYSFAIEDEMIFFNDRLTLIAGVSYDVNKPEEAYDRPVPDKMDTVNPQLGMVYQIDNSWSVHASVAKKTQFPQLSELYSEMAGGNPNLEPQETIAYEIGMAKKFNNDLSISMAVFYNDFENRIVKEELPSGDRAYINKGESVFKGFEAEIDYITGFNLEIGVNYTFLEGKDRENRFTPALDAEYLPTHKYTLDVRYMFDFGLSISTQCIYTGVQIEYDRNGVKNRIDDFVVYNARLAQKLTIFNKITPEFFFEIENLLDENYEEGRGPTPGRSFLVGVSITF